MSATSSWLPVLMYHSIDDGTSPLSTSPSLFRWQMEYLSAHGWATLAPSEILPGLRQGAWPERTFAITFDDAFASVAERALPVLSGCGFSAIVFAVAGYVGCRNDWPGQAGWVQPQSLLDWSELRSLAAAGLEIGAHTCTHPHLPRLTLAGSEQEMRLSKERLEDGLGTPVSLFAYPYGETSVAIERLAMQYFAAAFGTTLAPVALRSRPWTLERIDMYYLKRPALLHGLISGRLQPYLSFRRWLRSARRLAAGA